METLTYERPTNVAAAIAVLARPGAKPLAGGTNLVDLMKLGVERPDVLVDVNRPRTGQRRPDAREVATTLDVGYDEQPHDVVLSASHPKL